MNNYITVSALSKVMKDVFDECEYFREVYIKGEISNFKSHSRGHLYFSLKDENSKINAIMFSNCVSKLNFVPKDGLKVLVVGRVSLYEATGNCQIYVMEMTEDGIGNLYAKYEELKKQLYKEGLFNPDHKKKIPKIPKRVGIITASTGAAIKDIVSTIGRRFPICETILFPSLVQGEGAKDDIVKNIKLAENYQLDTLIIGRGGGSIEDLWAFNEEVVARAIYDCPIPIISAVGHEVDYTISDYVADLRAPTPTGAAEMAVPDIEAINSYLDASKLKVTMIINNMLDTYNKLLIRIKNSYVLKRPMTIYEIKEQKFDNLIERLKSSIDIILNKKKVLLSHITDSYIIKNPDIIYREKMIKLDAIINSLEVLNPMNTLKRGYAIIRKNDKVVSLSKHISINDEIIVYLKDGKLKSKIIEVVSNNE